MKRFLPLCIIVCLAFSCSEGSQTAQKMQTIVKKTKPKIENIILMKGSERLDFKVGEILFDGQFLRSENTYYNLSDIQMLKVNGTTLEASF